MNFDRRKFIAAASLGVAGLLCGKNVYAQNGNDYALEKHIGNLLKAKKLTVATAESCTGGLVASRLTDIDGASAYVKGGVVSYTNEIKQNILHVKPETLNMFGAVSSQTAKEMATNVRKIFSSSIGLSTTGLAGSSNEGKPSGLVYVCAVGENFSEVKECHFQGSRTEIKAQAVEAVLKLLADYVN
ncbi:MAG: nicotinamide-nucleotide amidohydrolase family protein [Selenomonadaceae bacterium]|nr:nicotinamide-nucleotide amidohydrolase family protein [Selenomonadaceae bacterium]